MNTHAPPGRFGQGLCKNQINGNIAGGASTGVTDVTSGNTTRSAREISS